MNFRGLAFRAHNPRWSWAPTSGEGAAQHGGRFNPTGLPALYLSVDRDTALMEASQGFAQKPQPLTLVAYEVDCADLVDLTSTQVRATWATSVDDLGCAWKLLQSDNKPVPSWLLVSRLLDAGIAGILVRSFAVGCGEHNVNIVLWRWSDDLPHKVRVVDDQGRLPRDDSSWRSTS